MKYGCESSRFEEVQTMLKSKQMELNVEEKGSSTKLLLAREKNIKKRCFLCGKEGHIEKNCLNKNKKVKNCVKNSRCVNLAFDGYETVEVLLIIT